jgi:hypothetical protein
MGTNGIDTAAHSAHRLARAVDHLDAVRLSDGRYAYHDDGMRRWYLVSASDLADLVDYLDSDDEAIMADAYSHWCAGSIAQEMPAGWTPPTPSRSPTPPARTSLNVRPRSTIAWSADAC